MFAPADNQPTTEAEYLALERASEVKHEFIDGTVYAMVGASEAHIDITGNIFAALHGQLSGGSCKVYASEMRVRIAASGAYVYPDVTVACGEREFADDTPDVDGHRLHVGLHRCVRGRSI